MSDDFEVYAEWIIRRLKEINFDTASYEEIVRWVLSSLGIKELGVKIFLYLLDKKRATSTEIAEVFNISPATARKYLEQLHSLGLVDYIGREYHLTREDLSGCIRDILIPRINKVLDYIADIAERADKLRFGGEEPKGSYPMRSILLDAKKRAIDNLKRSLKEKKMYREEIFSSLYRVLDRLFSDIEFSLKNLDHGISIYFGSTPKKTIERRRLPVSGISISERDDKIYYSVYSEFVMRREDLENAQKEGKKMIIDVYDTLIFDKDIPPELSSVIERLTIYGTVVGPREFIDNIRFKTVYGRILYY